MSIRFRRILPFAFAALLCCSMPLHRVHAQEPLKNDAGAAQPQPQEKNPAEAESKEKSAAEEIKNAPAVRALARATGMTNTQAYWVSVLLNFAIIVAFMAWVVKKTAPGIFKARNESIQKRIEEARKSSEEARRRLTEVEGRLSRLDAEIAEMRREAEDNARAEEKRVEAELEQERLRIVNAAEQEIAAATGAARRELKAYAAELAVSLAEKKIKIAKDTDQMLVREFTVQLGKDGN